MLSWQKLYSSSMSYTESASILMIMAKNWEVPKAQKLTELFVQPAKNIRDRKLVNLQLVCWYTNEYSSSREQRI